MTSEIAQSIFAVGCRNNLITATPFKDCDSICSMLLTLVVRERSKIETIRVSISDGAKPVYVQMTLMTGMLMLGKISIGVRSRTTGLIRSSTTENTMNVYGRARASFTIHIRGILFGYLPASTDDSR